jgi:hypothetical protein
VISVDKAEVTVDGNKVDVTGKTAKATVENPGPHRVWVTAAGREPFEQTIETAAGSTAQVVAKLERAKSSSKKTTTTATKTDKTTTTKTQPTEGTGQGSAKPVTDKNAPIDPFK